ncbi:MAG: fimbrillin family protein [Prevotellaceae bacterium]|jgi:uncharacterized protein (TIGR02145 family)|nr:fimbrillin family protein [Prevotellaceae bacterium]
MQKYYLFICLCLLASCHADLPIDKPEGENAYVSFEAEMDGANTRILDTCFEEGDVVGIAFADDRHTISGYKRYIAHVGANGGNTFTIHPDEPDRLRYPDANTPVAFTAFAPYKQLFADGRVAYDLSDQSTLEKRKACDYVYLGQSNSYKQTDRKAVRLIFSHMLSKITINITDETGTADFGTATCALTEVPTHYAHDMSHDHFVPMLTGVITPYIFAQSTKRFAAEAILLPGSCEDDYDTAAFNFTFQGKTHAISFVQAGITTLQSGKSYAFDFIFIGDKIKLQGATIDDWVGRYNYGASEYARSTPSSFQLTPKGSTETLTITTTSDAEPKFTCPAWIQIDPATITSSQLANGDYQWTIPFRSSRNKDGKRRENFLVATVGGFQLPVKISQEYTTTHDNLANCYVLHKQEAIHIPITRAYTQGGYTGNASNLTLELVLLNNQDFSNKTKYIEIVDNKVTGTTKDDAYFTVKSLAITDESYGSNYLVLAKYNNTVYWSWHIWFTEYEPYDTYTGPYGHGYWPDASSSATYKAAMTRNLGQITPIHELNSVGQYGLYYQWGRKDPFAFQGDGVQIMPRTASRPDHPIDAVRNPTTLYFVGKRPDATDKVDWLQTSNDTLWNNNGKKTVFDPCPDGWRIPVSNPWENAVYASYDESGTEFTGTMLLARGSTLRYNSKDCLFFPTCGMYEATYSTAPTMWRNGFGLWTAQAAGAKSYAVYVYYSTASTPGMAARNRIEGNNVRCVKDE